jgi:acyl carrier protein
MPIDNDLQAHGIPMATDGGSETGKGHARQDESLGEDALMHALRRLPEATRAAACAFRNTGCPVQLDLMVEGIIGHYRGDGRGKVPAKDEKRLRLMEDLAVDSFTMLEIVFLAEDVFQIAIETEDIRTLRTVEDVKRLVRAKVLSVAADGSSGLVLASAARS